MWTHNPGGIAGRRHTMSIILMFGMSAVTDEKGYLPRQPQGVFRWRIALDDFKRMGEDFTVVPRRKALAH